MREKPILFSGPMVRAILDGRKTQTRRVVTPQPVLHADSPLEVDDGALFGMAPDGSTVIVRHRFGNHGDRLWVRETWRQSFKRTTTDSGCTYLADYGHRLDLIGERAAREAWTWRPSIHMPRWASRLTLEVQAVRVERLQEITPEAIVAEGIEVPLVIEVGMDGSRPEFDAVAYHRDLRAAWQKAWDALNAKRGVGWDANPWVWVVTFKRVREFPEVRT